MKILVTGGTGVVGMGSIPELVAGSHQVRLLSRHARRDVGGLPGRSEAFVADISDATSLAGAARSCDAVIHLAGIVEEVVPELTFEKVNVAGTRALLREAEAAGAPLFVYMSSLGVEKGSSPYHASKRAAEEAVQGYAGPWVIVRPGGVYGPGDETISTLFKMVRTLPAVPMVREGQQPFQPIWFRDLGRAVAQIVSEPARFRGRTLTLGGREVTTTEQVLDKIATITGRNPRRVAVPEWLAWAGTHALEAFDGAGQRLLRRLGLHAPISSSQLGMLIEDNVIASGVPNALVEDFSGPITSLDDGLRELADLAPEQLPGEGVGAIKTATFSAEIAGSTYSAAALLEKVCSDLSHVMPIEFSAEPGAPAAARPGNTMTAEIVGRGHVQVRMEERTPHTATFATLEGHPLAGVMQLHAEDTRGNVRFSVRTASQAADVFDWIAMNTVGAALQEKNWIEVVQRVVALSGGEAANGVVASAHTMDEAEVRPLQKWIDRLVEREQRGRLDTSTTSASR